MRSIVGLLAVSFLLVADVSSPGLVERFVSNFESLWRRLS